jgi:hypothetical protein
MKTILTIIVILLSMGTQSQAKDLMKLGLDNASSLGLKIQTDSQVKVEGTGSIKISTLWPTSVCLGEFTGLDIENAKLVYTAKVKSNLKGTVFLEMWVHLGGGQYFSRGMNSAVIDKSDWRLIHTPFIFQRGQKPDKVTLNIIINGKGTVWVDDVMLSKEPLK